MIELLKKLREQCAIEADKEDRLARERGEDPRPARYAAKHIREIDVQSLVYVPTLPSGSRGVTVEVISHDPPVAVLRFDPGGVLGEDIHSVDEMFLVARGEILLQVDGVTHDVIRRDYISAGERHTLTAGKDGAVVVACFAPPRSA